MKEVGLRELKEHTSEVLRRVCEDREAIAISRRGRVIAHLVPVVGEQDAKVRDLAILAELDQLAQEISKYWPEGVSAVDAVREQRRDF